MTRTLRRGHLAAWLVLAPAILGVLIAALAARARADAALDATIRHAGVRP